MRRQLVCELEKIEMRGRTIADQRALFEAIVAFMGQLQASGTDVNHDILLDRILGKFSENIQRKVLAEKRYWERSDELGYWSWISLEDALEMVIEDEEALQALVRSHNQDPRGRNRKEDSVSHSQSRVNVGEKRVGSGTPVMKRPRECYFCDSHAHFGRDCPTAITVADRKDKVRLKKLCFICFGNHMSTNCDRARRCAKCGGNHHPLLCDRSIREPKQQPREQKTSSSSTSANANRGTNGQPSVQKTANAVSSKTKNKVRSMGTKSGVKLLVGSMTVLSAKDGKLRSVDVLLDSGADCSFIASELADELGLAKQADRSIDLHTFGQDDAISQFCSEVELQIWDSEGTPEKITLLTNERLVSTLSSAELTIDDLQMVSKQQWKLSADPLRRTLKPLVLLGCDTMWSFMRLGEESRQLPSGHLLIPTRFGYMCTGKGGVAEEEDKKPKRAYMISSKSSFEDEKDRMDQYWAMESAGVEEFTGPLSEEKLKCDNEVLENFEKTVERRSDGYYVRFPWKTEEVAALPDNRSIAYRRLQSVLRQLGSDPELLQRYHDTFMDQLEKGVIEEVRDESCVEGILNYIPHQAVVTPHKETTKLRVVFDASAHFKGKPSLNDVIHQGPVILPDLHGVMLRFRVGKYAMISDVEKAFLQVRLHEEDRDATRFLWVRDLQKDASEENTIVYRFTRVLFGVNASPFLLGATIKHHLRHTSGEDSLLLRQMDENLYVDNLLLTGDTIDEMIDMYNESKRTFTELNMNLREFLASGGDSINGQIASIDRARNLQPKVLGIPWHSEEDSFFLRCSFPCEPSCTKRIVSRQLASIYDPMGWMYPLVLRGKLFLQRLWRDGFDWDEELPWEIQEEWAAICHDWKQFEFMIPRHLLSRRSSVDLIAFSDASVTSMAACVYLRSDSETHLLMAKGKLASIKHAMTVPKMEMSAATLGARLLWAVYCALRDDLIITSAILLSDSEIALSWLQGPAESQNGGVLVKNRVKEIRAISSQFLAEGLRMQCGYVATDVNPADCATRGLTSSDLRDHYWWKGPAFLSEPCWPELTRLFILRECEGEEELDEQPAVKVFAATVVDKQECVMDWSRHSSCVKGVRVMAYVLRFVKALSRNVKTANLREKLESMTTEGHTPALKCISAEEMKMAERYVWRDHQRVFLSTERLKLLRDVNPKIGADGVLRCYGRLDRSELSVDAKHPILLDNKSRLAFLVTRDCHLATGIHRTTGETMAAVRERFWIPRLREMAKKVIRRCVPCQKVNNLPFAYPDMSDLPSKRVVRARPFENVGLDYFGPIHLKGDKKVYGCIITCAVTRLIHLEMVEDLTTEQFLHALRRFWSRRGVPATIICDNASTFILGEEILRIAVEKMEENEELETVMATKGIVWKHITPYSPWMGGFYERLVKSVKHAMYKTLGKRKISETECMTLLAEVEGTVNGRPLTYLEENWESQPLLRPIDFIVRDMCLTHPRVVRDDGDSDEDYLPPDEECRLRTRRCAERALQSSEQLAERFWKIWSEQYLKSLRETHKLRMNNKRGSSQELTEGCVVLLCEELTPRHLWRVGRIEKLVSSSDGSVREVEVRLANGKVFRKAVCLLVPLELSEAAGADEDALSSQARERSLNSGDIVDPLRVVSVECAGPELGLANPLETTGVMDDPSQDVPRPIDNDGPLNKRYDLRDIISQTLDLLRDLGGLILHACNGLPLNLTLPSNLRTMSLINIFIYK